MLITSEYVSAGRQKAFLLLIINFQLSIVSALRLPPYGGGRGERPLFLYARLYKVKEQRMRLENCALVLWMELCSDVPLELWYLNNLDEV